jgi:hypothetical protein
MLQELRPIYKTRNQFMTSIGKMWVKLIPHGEGRGKGIAVLHTERRSGWLD